MEPLIGYPAITFNTIALDTYYENVSKIVFLNTRNYIGFTSPVNNS